MTDDGLLATVAEESGQTLDNVHGILGALAAAVRSRLEVGASARLSGIGTLSTGPSGVRFEPDRALSPAAMRLLPPWWEDEDHQSARRLARTLVADLALYERDRAPTLSASMADDDVVACCADVFGYLWAEALRTYVEAVDDDVRSAHDHLVEAARQRWGPDSPSRRPSM